MKVSVRPQLVSSSTSSNMRHEFRRLNHTLESTVPPVVSCVPLSFEMTAFAVTEPPGTLLFRSVQPSACFCMSSDDRDHLMTPRSAITIQHGSKFMSTYRRIVLVSDV